MVQGLGDRVALLGPDAVSLGGSEYLWTLHRKLAGPLAPLDLAVELAVQGACRAAIDARLVGSAHDCAEGGLAVALAEACVSSPAPLGAEVELTAADGPAALPLFGEGPSRIVVSVAAEAQRHFERLMGEFAVPWRWIGRVGGDRLVIRLGPSVVVSLAVDRIEHAWRNGFERLVG